MYSGNKTHKGIAGTVLKGLYVGDLEHPSHLGLESVEEGFIGIESEAEFQLAACLVTQSRGSEKGGRPRSIVAIENECRTPKGAWFTDIEKDRWLVRLVERQAIQKGKFGFHNHFDGATDLHLIGLNRRADGFALRGPGEPSHIVKLRAINDEFEAEILAERKAAGLPGWETMKEAKKRIAGARGLEPLPDLVFRKSKEEGLTEWSKIEKRIGIWTQAAGHKVTRKNSRFIGVLFSGSRKAKRFKLVNLKSEVMPRLISVPPIKPVVIDFPVIPKVMGMSPWRAVSDAFDRETAEKKKQHAADREKEKADRIKTAAEALGRRMRSSGIRRGIKRVIKIVAPLKSDEREI